jgi:hypothetical protein
VPVDIGRNGPQGLVDENRDLSIGALCEYGPGKFRNKGDAGSRGGGPKEISAFHSCGVMIFLAGHSNCCKRRKPADFYKNVILRRNVTVFFWIHDKNVGISD